MMLPRKRLPLALITVQPSVSTDVQDTPPIFDSISRPDESMSFTIAPSVSPCAVIGRGGYSKQTGKKVGHDLLVHLGAGSQWAGAGLCTTRRLNRGFMLRRRLL